jgi:hypothetical protein
MLNYQKLLIKYNLDYKDDEYEKRLRIFERVDEFITNQNKREDVYSQ